MHEEFEACGVCCERMEHFCRDRIDSSERGDIVFDAMIPSLQRFNRIRYLSETFEAEGHLYCKIPEQCRLGRAERADLS